VFDVGWSELLVIGVVAVLVVGPKDLPKMLRTFGKTMTQLRRMAGDFQRQFDEAVKEADLDDVRKSVTGGSAFKPLEDARKSMQSFQKSVGDQVRGIENDVKAAPAVAKPAEPQILPPAQVVPPPPAPAPVAEAAAATAVAKPAARKPAAAKTEPKAAKAATPKAAPKAKKAAGKADA